jgi:fibronectin type 3 domain-containing protein
MKKILFLTGTLSMLLIFGMSFIGCDDGTNQINLNNETSRAVVTKPKAPAAPSKPNVTAKTTDSIAISWSSVTGADGYKVYRSSNPNSGYTHIAKPSAPKYTDYTVKANTTYYYKVAAYSNAAGEGNQSPYVLAKTEKVIKPAIPSKPNVINTTSNSISINWSSVAGADGYYVWRNTSPTGTYTRLGPVASTTYTNLGLKANTQYYYKVSAFNTAGDSKDSPYAPAKTLK